MNVSLTRFDHAHTYARTVQWVAMTTDEHDDEADAPFAFTDFREHLTRLRETCLELRDGKLVSLTDEELARRIRQWVPISRGQVQAWSSGKSENPTADKLLGLSNAYGISPLYWFSASARRRVLKRLDARLDELHRQLLFGSVTDRAETSHGGHK